MFFCRAEEYHDNYAFEHGFLARIPGGGSGIVWTNLNFYNSMLNDHPIIQKRKLAVEKKSQTIVPFVNLAADETTNTADKGQLPFDIPYFMNQHEKELCKGKQNKVITLLLVLHIGPIMVFVLITNLIIRGGMVVMNSGDSKRTYEVK